MSNMKSKSINDVSFSNIFWKQLAIRLFVMAIISAIIIYCAQWIVVDLCQQGVDGVLSEVSLSLAQLEDMEMSKDKTQTVANTLLSKAQDDLNANPCVLESSLSLYNLGNRELAAKSYKIPIIESDEIVEWWKDQAGTEDGLPKISLSDDMIEFCNTYADKEIYVERLYCLNSILFPTQIVAKDANGTKLETCEALTPSTVTEKVTMAPIRIVGNSSEDAIYSLMSDYILRRDEITKEVIVSYNSSFEHQPIELISQNFTINGIDYQVDCGYQINFWVGAWQYVVAFELFGIVLCAAIALINTKEMLAIYQ